MFGQRTTEGLRPITSGNAAIVYAAALTDSSGRNARYARITFRFDGRCWYKHVHYANAGHDAVDINISTLSTHPTAMLSRYTAVDGVCNVDGTIDGVPGKRMLIGTDRRSGK